MKKIINKRFIYVKPDSDHMLIVDKKTGLFLGYAYNDKNVNIILCRDGTWQTGPRWRAFTPRGEEIGQFGHEHVAPALFRSVMISLVNKDRLERMNG